MIKEYIIDGNNLIGKIKELHRLQNKDKFSSREKLAFMLERYFINRHVKVKLHFDGHYSGAIKVSKIKIEYSENKTADENIKRDIAGANNPKLIAVVSSDHSVMQYAQKSSCTVMKSESFANRLKAKEGNDLEEKLMKEISNDEIKKMFGVE
ncbi:NYN domain-containing protein [Bacteroidota bacterium]